MTDVIFSGSENRKAQNMAEVTLVFDNSKYYLNSDLEEIEVTRRIYSTEQDAEYLINRNHVRLKDIVDLILDSGLGKDSLSMISQGNISAFAEAKPYERRAIFEEAAGVVYVSCGDVPVSTDQSANSHNALNVFAIKLIMLSLFCP